MPYLLGNFSHKTLPSTKLSDPRSAGDIFIGYSRSLGRVVSLGFMIGYEHFHTSGYRIVTSARTDPVSINDNLITGLVRVSLCYFSKPSFTIYYGIGLALTVDYGKMDFFVNNATDQHYLFGTQITLLGIRFGRGLGGFIEVGAGSVGILNAGLSYKFTKTQIISYLPETPSKKNTTNQKKVYYDDLSVGYGALSLFQYTGRSMGSNENYETPESWGSIHAGYSRKMNKVISLGCEIGYEDFHYPGIESVHYNGRDTSWAGSAEDRLITGIATLGICYLNKPLVRIYSTVGIGITIDDYGVLTPLRRSTGILKKPAGQITLFGLRVGRALGGYIELGYGSLGIVNAGLSYKFKN